MTDQNHDHVCDPPCVFDRRAARTRLRQWCDRSEAVLGESDSEDVRMVRRRIADIRLIVQHSDHAEALEEEVALLRQRAAMPRLPIVVHVKNEHQEIASQIISQVLDQIDGSGILMLPERMPLKPTAPPVTPSPRGTVGMTAVQNDLIDAMLEADTVLADGPWPRDQAALLLEAIGRELLGDGGAADRLRAHAE